MDRLKGKFRSFLLACFQNYLSVETHRAHRLKRGGQYQFVSLELETAEDRCRYEPADHLTAEKIFEARWALTLLDHAVTLLRREYVARGRGSVFEILKPFIGTMESKPEDSYEEAAKTLGVGVGTVKTLIHRLPGPGFAEEADGGSQVRRFENYEVTLDDDGKPIELGRGAMGVTYKAFDVDLHCPVTLKVIGERYLGDESARLRFLREARAAARLRHSKVASVLNLGRTGSSYFYAMEFVEGETFENLIKRSGRLEVKLALEIAMQVAAGLAAVHEQNLVHRDIKPTNIMVRLKKEGSVTAKIIDFGLAKTVDQTASEAGISSPGVFAGTPEFASPEQFAGVGVGIRSDLYSLWVIVTGQTPFRGTSAEVMYQHQHAPLPLERLQDVPQPVVVLLEKLLEKDPHSDSRLQTGHQRRHFVCR